MYLGVLCFNDVSVGPVHTSAWCRGFQGCFNVLHMHIVGSSRDRLKSHTKDIFTLKGVFSQAEALGAEGGRVGSSWS